jgi:hypothetical protein
MRGYPLFRLSYGVAAFLQKVPAAKNFEGNTI